MYIPPMESVPTSNIASPELAQRVRSVRMGLLHLHKMLLDAERERYEREHGGISSTGQLLQLVISDPWFAWLHPLSELIVAMDEWMEAPEASVGTKLLDQTRALLKPGAGTGTFQQEYDRFVQADPKVVVLHAELVQQLNEKSQNNSITS